MQRKIDFAIDLDYLDFIKKHDGSEGFLNENTFIQFWNIDDLIALNPYYEDVEKCGKLFFFGTDGSNLGFAFSKLDSTIVSIDFLEILDKDPDFVSKTFISFLIERYQRN